MDNTATKIESDPGKPAATNADRPQVPVWLAAALLALFTLALYWPATGNDFIAFDDPLYVVGNTQVQSGLTWDSLEWALVNPVCGNWHPVTIWSHMLDCQLYGLKPWGHHLTNILLHALNTALVFLLLRQLTGAFWRSAAVAALFAAHPLHVESVAWIAERKDVLSTFFGLLTLLAYVKYVASDKCQVTRTENAPVAAVSPVTCHLSRFYWLALLFFALGLMSKPMLVTLPCVMLLLDYWPLRRVTGGGWQVTGIKQLVWEKIPFFALAVVASFITMTVQEEGGAFEAGEGLPLGARIGNALISYCRYLGKIFWPTDLAIYYPHPGYWPLAEVLLAGVFLCAVSALFVLARRRYPFLLMGWLWFVGMLVPVIGLVQVGGQAMADRYTYLPSLGVLVPVVWGAHELSRSWRFQKMILAVTGSVALVLCLILTRQQLGYWKDSETLYRHALAVTENNYFVHGFLAEYLNLKGRTDEAVGEFREALRLKPDYPNARVGLGVALAHQGRFGEAIPEFQEALRLKPNDADACYDLGLAFAGNGQMDEAIQAYREAIRIRPDHADAHYNLGIALFGHGQTDEAMEQFQEAVRLKPAFGPGYAGFCNLIDLNNQAWQLATSPDAGMRDGARAVQIAENACEQTHYQVTIMVGTLAAAYAEAGRFDEAVATGQKACALASKLGDTNLLARNQELVVLYKAHKAYHESAK